MHFLTKQFISCFLQDKKVDSFVTFVNSQLRQRQENERLKTIIARIESYDPVVSVLILVLHLLL